MATKTLELEILSIGTPVFTKTARGGYSSLEIAYKNLTFEGKVEGKKVVDFNDKAVFAFLQGLSQGDVITVVAEKGENDQFWKWVSATNSDGTGSPALPESSGEASAGKPVKEATASRGGVSGGPGRVTGSNYETSDERAKRQVYIVRQSSISAAVGFLSANGAIGAGKATVEDVIELAKEFEEYVFA